MSETRTFTESDIHYFTRSEGRKWAHMPWGMITGDIPSGVVYPTTLNSVNAASHGMESRIRGGDYTYPAYGKGREYAIIPADRIEVVTEHVEATVMDALQALVASGGKPVEGWSFNDYEGESFVDLPIRGVDTEDKILPFMAEFNGCQNWYRYAYRLVTRVRIKAEAKPEPKFKVGDLVEACAKMLINVPVPFGKVTKATDTIHGYQYDVNLADGKWLCPFENELRPWTPGYGYTLDGNPVPPPPEGWEIVPEGDGIGVSCIYYAPDTQEWEEGMVNGSHAFVANRARAYARRVVKVSLTPEAQSTAEKSSVVGLPDLMGLMTKREAFAMAAMQGTLSCNDRQSYRTVAEYAVAYADALLAELEKGKEAK